MFQNIDQMQTTYTLDACIHSMFEIQAEQTPEACAVIFKDERLTYGELNGRANRLAWNLVKLGVGPDVTVGIFAERSIEVIIGLLGVLKAGGTCLPLDPEYPKERLAFMLHDGEVQYLLVDGEYLERLPENDAKIIPLDFVNEISGIALEGPDIEVSPDGAAYLIYTSGSTGKPKGVEITHRGILGLLFGVNYVRLDKTKAVLQLSALTFDGSIFDIWAALLHGGRSVLYPGRIPLVRELSDVLRKHQVTTAFLTTSFFNAIVDEEPIALASLEQLLVGGEALSVQHICRAWDALAGVEIINAYGPTEGTVFAAAYRILQKPDAKATSIPIGRHIGNTRAYILDQNLQQVSIGMRGELYLGGPGVARGYRNRPELTAQKFISDPFSKEPNARLYKTGDLACFLADGNIDFLGRTDDQIKVRGFRIEPAEIEASLRCHEGVLDAVTLVCTDRRGEKCLSAFVVRKLGLDLSADELREFLRQRVPEFMIPSRYRVLDRWPLTSSGKVDRQALARADDAPYKISSANFAPQTASQRALVQMWEELLNVRPIGMRDNFFDLGGNSILAIRLLAQIEVTFNKRLPIETLIGAVTIAQLSTLLNQEEPPDRFAYAVPVQSKGENPVFFCVGAGFLMNPLSLQLGPDQPFYSIGLKPDYAAQLERPFKMEELAQHLVSALRGRQPAGPYYVGGFCLDGLFAYEVARQLKAQGQNVGLLVLFETENPCQIAKTRIGIALRRTVIRLRYRYNQLFSVKINEIPVYARSRWVELKQLMTRISWRVYEWFPFVKRQIVPADLERILFTAARAYETKPLECPTVIFRCKEWPIAAAGDPYLGWRELLNGPCETHEVPGDHEGMFLELNAKVLAEQLTASLRNARQAENSTGKVCVDAVKTCPETNGDGK
jgi:amino acid adenylation domain-containing protein